LQLLYLVLQCIHCVHQAPVPTIILSVQYLR
jgi:hypothetical protein